MKDIVSFLREDYHPWVVSLTNEERYAIRKYSWNSQETMIAEFFNRLNSFLRGKSTLEEKMLEKYSVLISKAIRKHLTTKGIICYRGTNYDMSEGASIGETFLYNQFTSTSVVKSRAFKRKYLFIIHVPPGTRAAYIEELSFYPRQRELLIDKNILYKVLSREDNLIELEVVSDDKKMVKKNLI